MDRKTRLERTDALFETLDDLFFALLEDGGDDLEEAGFAVIKRFAAPLRGFGVHHAKAHQFGETLGDQARRQAKFGADLALAHGCFVVKQGSPDPTKVRFEAEAIKEFSKDRHEFFAWRVVVWSGIRHVEKVVCGGGRWGGRWRAQRRLLRSFGGSIAHDRVSPKR